MKVRKTFSFVLVAALVTSACQPSGSEEGKKKVRTPKPAIKATENVVVEGNGDGSEHCLVAGEKSYCFLEKDSEDGPLYYAYGDSYAKLLPDPILSDIQIQLQSVDQAKYESLKKTTAVKLEYEGARSNGVIIKANQMDEQAMFTDLMFRVIAFLWKADRAYNRPEPTGTLDKIKQKIKDLAYKAKDKIKASVFSKASGGASVMQSAIGLKARITWKYASAEVLKELPIPPEYLASEAELEALEKAAMEQQAMK